MRQIRIAAQLHPQHGTYRAIRTAAIRAEEIGFDVLYTWDHFFPLYGDRDGAHLECWSLLAAWAEATDRIELGSLVSPVGYRNPNLLADMARTVDQVSGGRVILGLGAGWKRRDYEAYGYPFGTWATRIGALGEAIPVIRGRLAALNPPPVRTMPLLIAGQGLRRTLPIVAAHADVWHAGFPSSPAEMTPVVDGMQRACAEAGRDPGTIEWSLGVEPDDLGRFLDEDADAYHALGFRQFTLGFNGPDWNVDAEPVARWMAWRDAHNDAGDARAT